MTTISLTTKNKDLWQHYQDKKVQDRMLFPTEGARALGVSELELMLAAPFSEYMGTDCKAVLKQFESFGRLESIVRNDLAVHEKLVIAYHVPIFSIEIQGSIGAKRSPLCSSSIEILLGSLRKAI